MMESLCKEKRENEDEEKMKKSGELEQIRDNTASDIDDLLVDD